MLLPWKRQAVLSKSGRTAKPRFSVLAFINKKVAVN